MLRNECIWKDWTDVLPMSKLLGLVWKSLLFLNKDRVFEECTHASFNQDFLVFKHSTIFSFLHFAILLHTNPYNISESLSVPIFFTSWLVYKILVFMFCPSHLKSLDPQATASSFFPFPIISPTGDMSTSPPPCLHHSRDSVPPHCLLSLCPQGSGSRVASAAFPPGGEAPWSPPGRKRCPGTTWGTGTTPWRLRPSPRSACWSSPCWSSAALSCCWPCRGITAQPHSDYDLEEGRQRNIYFHQRVCWCCHRCQHENYTTPISMKLCGGNRPKKFSIGHSWSRFA